jgi:acetyl-CoA carboxylase biotin carboxylase subunit
MCEAAVRLAKSAGYVNAGTCEFLVDADYNFYFIEVNARIQVEHPVTELVTGLDLIKEQIRIAGGEPLSVAQADVNQLGHAIECRINCEDPEHNFRPSPGLITGLRIPGGIGVRWDSHIIPGYRVPPNYDSMIGKLLVHAPTRIEAIARMLRALGELRIEGITTTAGLHQRILRSPDFLDGRVDTTWVERVLLAPREKLVSASS